MTRAGDVAEMKQGALVAPFSVRAEIHATSDKNHA